MIELEIDLDRKFGVKVAKRRYNMKSREESRIEEKKIQIEN